MGYLAWKAFGLSIFKKPSLYFYALIAIVPFVWWRWWISHYPEGIPAFTWLLNGNGIRFKGAWFWWLFAQRIGLLILGGWGLVLFCFRNFEKKRTEKEGWFFYLWLLSSLLYLVVIATGNVQHDYYQI